MSSRYFLVKLGQNPTSFLFIFVLFLHCKDKYSTNLTINDKSVDGVLGSQTWGGRMESEDEFTELWGHPSLADNLYERELKFRPSAALRLKSFFCLKLSSTADTRSQITKAITLDFLLLVAKVKQPNRNGGAEVTSSPHIT